MLLQRSPLLMVRESSLQWMCTVVFAIAVSLCSLVNLDGPSSAPMILLWCVCHSIDGGLLWKEVEDDGSLPWKEFENSLLGKSVMVKDLNCRSVVGWGVVQ